MKIITGTSNIPLAKEVADYINIPLANAAIKRFADDEVFVEIKENIRGEAVFVIWSTSYPANDNLVELLVTIEIIKSEVKTHLLFKNEKKLNKKNLKK